MQRQVLNREQKTRLGEVDLGLTPFKSSAFHNSYGPNFSQSNYNGATLYNFNIK